MMVTKVCVKCGSERIRLTTFVEWYTVQQRWVVSGKGSEFDIMWCMDCNMEVDYEDVEVHDDE